MPLPVGSARLYQMKITLKGIEPPIWRRFVVPTFMKLSHFHVILQHIMGWENIAASEFLINGNRFAEMGDYEVTEDGLIGLDAYDAANYELSQLLKSGMKFTYIYDFENHWEHEIVVENDNFNRNVEHPYFCFEGDRACPPEGCEGPEGYATVLEVLNDPDHPEHEECKEWLGTRFSSERYLPDESNRELGVRRPGFLIDDTKDRDRDAERKKKKQERQRKKEARKRR